MKNFEQPHIEDGENSKDRTKSSKISRRDFLKQATVFSSAVVLSPKELFAQQPKSPELSDDAEVNEISDFIAKHKEIVDYAKLWKKETPVLFIGERHTLTSDKAEIISSLPRLKQLGMTHLAMEMLEEQQQPIVDNYTAGKITREKALEPV
jgi:uncharacterized iron-regulated protein